MWKQYFKFINLVPGKVVVPRYGKVDFSRNDLPLDMVRDLYENDFPYLQITDEGLKELYGITPEINTIEETQKVDISEEKTQEPTQTINKSPKNMKKKKKID